MTLALRRILLVAVVAVVLVGTLLVTHLRFQMVALAALLAAVRAVLVVNLMALPQIILLAQIHLVMRLHHTVLVVVVVVLAAQFTDVVLAAAAVVLMDTKVKF
jgi:hypothetical protein